jgi:MFS family permease
VIVLAVLYFFAVLDRQLVALLAPQIKADLGLSDVQIGLLQGLAFAATFTLCGVPIGWAVDRFSRRLVIFAGIVVWSLASAASGLAGSFSTLFVARAGVGAGEAALNPSAYSILAQTYDAGRLTLALSLFSIGGNLGSAMSYILGGAFANWLVHRPPLDFPFLGPLAGWRAAFMLAGLPGVAVGLLVFIIREPRRTDDQPTAGRTPQFHDLFRRYARFPAIHSFPPPGLLDHHGGRGRSSGLESQFHGQQVRLVHRKDRPLAWPRTADPVRGRLAVPWRGGGPALSAGRP